MQKIKRNLVPCIIFDQSYACNVIYVLDWCHTHNDTSGPLFVWTT